VDAGCLCNGMSAGRLHVSDDSIERVREAFQQSPRNSVARASRELRMPKMTVWKVMLALATDLRGLCLNASRTLSMVSSHTGGRPGLPPLHKHPVSTNFKYHLVTLFLCGASFLNRARKSRCTVIADLYT
jgi:hypothetical protein